MRRRGAIGLLQKQLMLMKVVVSSFSRAIIALVFAAIFAHSPLAAQQTHSFRDGAPLFTRVAVSQNVRVDSVISLLPAQISRQEPAGFDTTLSGIDPGFSMLANPVLGASDFDDVAAPSTFYLVTVGPDRKVVAVSKAGSILAFEFNAARAGSATFLPVDCFNYRDGGLLRLLITDQGDHRVILVDFETQDIRWQYGSTQGAGPNQLSRPSDAVKLPDSARVLICDTGNNRAIIVDTTNKAIVWSSVGVSLNNPVDVEYDTSANAVLITDQNNHQVIMVRRSDNQIIFRFGEQGVSGTGSRLNSPSDADLLPDGTILICDTGNNRLIQVDRQGQIVYAFHRPLSRIADADRLANNRTLAIFDRVNGVPLSLLPQVLAYMNEDLISKQFDFGRKVDFDSLFWDGQVVDGVTSIRFQLRSSPDQANLATAPWLGPTGSSDFYTTRASRINPAHDGSQYFQYRVFLGSTNVLQTPTLTQFNVKARFFDDAVTGTVSSEVIADSAQNTISGWTTLRVLLRRPETPNFLFGDVSLEVRLVDTTTSAVFFSNLSNFSDTLIFDLRPETRLRQKQAVRFEAFLKTINGSVTPILDEYQITWNFTRTTKGTISFVDSLRSPSSFYRADSASQRPPRVGAVFVRLDDGNLLDVQSTINLQISSRLSNDVQAVTLEKQDIGFYLLRNGLPIVVTDFVGMQNGLLEVSDRDTLVVNYTDPTDPTDTSVARALVIGNVSGSLSITDARGAAIDTAGIGATLYLQLTGEFDRNLSPARDTVVAEFFNNVTQDVQKVTMLEVQNETDNDFTTGKFFSAFGVPVVRGGTSVPDDGKLQSLPGNDVGARFIDFDNRIVQDALTLFPDPADTIPNPRNLAYEFEFGPNPYRVRAESNQLFRIRGIAFTGDIELLKIEIYNLAGDRVRTLQANEVGLERGVFIRRGPPSESRSNWWNLRTESGEQVASGTYWAKIYVRLTTENAQTTNSSILRKFVIIQ
jgi:hypothetical protein